jgi:protoporphyrinogen oxidase
MKNFSKYLSPKGKTSLFIEFFCTEGDDMWNMDKEEVLKLFIKDSENMNLFKVEDIQNSYLMKKRNIYPVYDLFYEEKVKNVKDFLDSVPNLFAIGRPGRFRYNNQDHSLEMGIVAAKSIIENKRYDIETIGSDKEYYEKK